jgi:glycogen debranching enzyme
VQHSALGSPISNPSFVVASCGFNALVAFNAYELASITGDEALIEKADLLSRRLLGQWDEQLGTWVDTGDSASDSGRARSLDALLPVLVATDEPAIERVFDSLRDEAAFGGACGPAGMHRGEPTLEARTYWRGPAWPQLTYLFWVAARRHGRAEDATAFGGMLTRGALASSWAEYWDASDGTGLGAAPQSWAALAAVVQPR